MIYTRHNNGTYRIGECLSDDEVNEIVTNKDISYIIVDKPLDKESYARLNKEVFSDREEIGLCVSEDYFNVLDLSLLLK